MKRFLHLVLNSHLPLKWHQCQHCYKVPLRFSSTQKQATLLDSLYSKEEKENILECFNKCNEQDIQFTKHLNPQKVSTIIKHREAHGDFQTLSSILHVSGVGMLGLQKVCNVLKTMDYESLQKHSQKLDFEVIKSHPPLSKQDCLNIQSLVAMEIHVDRISWVKMGRDLEVEDWHQTQVFNKPFQKYDHIQFLEKLHHVLKNLPEADIYAMENKPNRISNLRTVPFIINLRIVEAVLVTLLNADFARTQKHKVYMISTHTVSKFFGLSIGGERVSGQHIIRDIMRHSSDVARDVKVPPQCWDKFHALDSIQQEKLANTLLLAVAFYKLLILRTDTLPL